MVYTAKTQIINLRSTNRTVITWMEYLFYISCAILLQILKCSIVGSSLEDILDTELTDSKIQDDDDEAESGGVGCSDPFISAVTEGLSRIIITPSWTLFLSSIVPATGRVDTICGLVVVVVTIVSVFVVVRSAIWFKFNPCLDVRCRFFVIE